MLGAESKVEMSVFSVLDLAFLPYRVQNDGEGKRLKRDYIRSALKCGNGGHSFAQLYFTGLGNLVKMGRNAGGGCLFEKCLRSNC